MGGDVVDVGGAVVDVVVVDVVLLGPDVVPGAPDVLVVGGPVVEVVGAELDVVVVDGAADSAGRVVVGSAVVVVATKDVVAASGTRGCVTSLRTAATAWDAIQTDSRVATIHATAPNRFTKTASHCGWSVALNHG